MGLATGGGGPPEEREEGRLYRGPPHRWRLPGPGSPLSFALAALAVFLVALELALVAYDYLALGLMRAGTAQLIGAAGVALLLAANAKSLALALARVADDALLALIDRSLPALWRLHFWIAPLALFSFGLFLLVTPVRQPPFYHVAFGVLLWQAGSGLMAREALPVPGGRAPVGRVARSAHRQPAVFVLLAVLVTAGFVDSVFP